MAVDAAVESAVFGAGFRAEHDRARQLGEDGAWRRGPVTLHVGGVLAGEDNPIWSAFALGIAGHGDTWEEALRELCDEIEKHAAFAKAVRLSLLGVLGGNESHG